MLIPDVEAHAMLDARFSGGPTYWLGLSTTEPRLQGGVYVDVTEPTAADYARVQVLPAEWSAAADRAVQADVVFADPVEDWGVIVGWVLFDAATGGVARYAGVPAEGADLQAGTSNVTVTARVEFPASL